MCATEIQFTFPALVCKRPNLCLWWSFTHAHQEKCSSEFASLAVAPQLCIRDGYGSYLIMIHCCLIRRETIWTTICGRFYASEWRPCWIASIFRSSESPCRSVWGVFHRPDRKRCCRTGLGRKPTLFLRGEFNEVDRSNFVDIRISPGDCVPKAIYVYQWKVEFAQL